MSDGARTLDAFVAVALVLGIGADELENALPPGTALPLWLPAVRGAREARAAALAPHLYRLQMTVTEAARWP